MLLIDKDIRDRCEIADFKREPMVAPFSEAVSGGGVISWGLTHSGYDLRLAYEVLVFRNRKSLPIDPKKFREEDYTNSMMEKVVIDRVDNAFCIPPNTYILGRSLEYLSIPADLKARCVGKSTLARSGILINTTPLEPSWRGHLTIEIGNVTPWVATIYAGEGICQIEFETLTGIPETTYADKKGIYQNQTDITTARVRS